MRRIAIIGNAGGGKSILARQLGEALDIPVFEIDQFQWRPGWVQTPVKDIARIHSQWLSEPAWIIDGWGGWDVIAARFERADTLVLVDLPLALHYWWAIKRQIKATLGLNSHWPPPGCKALPVTRRLLKLMWHVHTSLRPRLLDLMARYEGQKSVVYLRSGREMRRFLQTSGRPTPNETATYKQK